MQPIRLGGGFGCVSIYVSWEAWVPQRSPIRRPLDGARECFWRVEENGQRQQQKRNAGVSPLRCAPVEMTASVGDWEVRIGNDNDKSGRAFKVTLAHVADGHL